MQEKEKHCNTLISTAKFKLRVINIVKRDNNMFDFSP